MRSRDSIEKINYFCLKQTRRTSFLRMEDLMKSIEGKILEKLLYVQHQKIALLY